MQPEVNSRKKQLDRICHKIALFIVQQTYEDEGNLRSILKDTVKLLDQVSAECAANDQARDEENA